MGFMNIQNFQIYKYALPLNQPLTVLGHQLNNREGFIIHLESDANTEGFGEAAPLPGLSAETLQDALEQLQFLQSRFINLPIPDGVEKLDGAFDAWLTKFKMHPSVQFGIEMAVLNLIANGRNQPLHKLLSFSANDHIQINGLLQGDTNYVVHHAKELISEGFTALKLKVGGGVEENIHRVQAVTEVVAGRALLHLDANKSWNLEEAITFGKGIGCIFVDYIEEPLINISDIPEFYHQTSIPAALDESLSVHNFEEIKSIEGVEILVLKPTRLGSIEKIWGIMKEAQRLAIRTVISSGFESSLGLLTLAQLSATSGRTPSAGLDTFKWFKKDVFIKNLCIKNGQLIVKEKMIKKNNLDLDLIK